MEQDKKTKTKGQQDQKPNDITHRKIRMALSIGLAAGIIWGFVGFMAYYLQFTNVGTSIYAKPILNPSYVLKWQGHLIGIPFFILFTLIASFIYAFLLTRFKSPIAGVIYGIGLWSIIFLGLNPLIKLTKPIKELGFSTNTVMICLYIMIGLFIGYSLSVEFNNQDKGNEQ